MQAELSEDPVLITYQTNGKQELIFQFFQKFTWGFAFTSPTVILLPENLKQILMAIDYEYFCDASFPQRLSTLVSIIKTFMLKTMYLSFTPQIEKELLQQNIKTWISLIFYLFGNATMKQIFINKIFECSQQAQTYYMTLMEQIDANMKIQNESEKSQKQINPLEQIQNELKLKNEEIIEIQRELKRMKLQNQYIKSENIELKSTISKFLMERADQLHSVGVNHMEELLQLYKEAIQINQKLSQKVQKFEDQNCQLQQLYSGVSSDLVKAKHQNEQKESVLRTRVSTFRRRSSRIRYATNSDSEQEVSYKDSIEQSTRPLKQQISVLDQYNKNLRYQMRLLYRQFTKFKAELKPLKDQGMFEDVPRSVF